MFYYPSQYSAVKLLVRFFFALRDDVRIYMCMHKITILQHFFFRYACVSLHVHTYALPLQLTIHFMKQLKIWISLNSVFSRRVQLGSQRTDKFFLIVYKMIPCYEYPIGNFVEFSLNVQTSSGNCLKLHKEKQKFSFSCPCVYVCVIIMCKPAFNMKLHHYPKETTKTQTPHKLTSISLEMFLSVIYITITSPLNYVGVPTNCICVFHYHNTKSFLQMKLWIEKVVQS